MGLYESLLRPALFLLEPERAHERAMAALKSGLVRARPFSHPILAQELFGQTFGNPLGLAAGFDKNAEALDNWRQLGFGFVEVGTITFHPQPGNSKPRLFRIPDQKALVNRMGFNNEGAEAIAARIGRANPQLPIGINLGKSKITELADAPTDYQESYKRLHNLGDYFVVNVSSPNTPGLQTLQEKGPLLEILLALREVGSKPLFVKVSPDLAKDALMDVVEVARQAKLTGIVATNTTLRRDPLPDTAKHRHQAGGLSGRPLTALANETLKALYEACGKEMILIGVGGIFDGADLFERISAGSHLCQMYTGWIYGGPQTVPRVLQQFVDLTVKVGLTSLEQLRGSGISAPR